MSSDTILYTRNLQKIYHVYPSPGTRLKQIIYGERRQLFTPFTALKGIDLEMYAGDVVGIIGRNGSGKSTFLQLICGTLTPSSGDVVVRGRIAALLELGAGFNPEFTGRENIFLSASILGYSQEQTKEKLEEIIEFSGIRPFIDQPVKTYSSGMFVRLAFSVATSVDPDILVIDEALSVGDGDFAKRSFDRIMQMKEQGKTILFCSHSLYQVENLCNRVLWLDKGRLVADGPPEQVVPKYQSYLDQLGENQNSQQIVPGELRSGAYLTEVAIASGHQSGSNLTLRSGLDSLRVAIGFRASHDIPPPGVAVVIHADSGVLITSCGTWDDNFDVTLSPEGYGRVSVTFEDIPLLKGRYRLGAILFCEKGLYVYDEADPAAHFNVVQDSQARGLIALPRRWFTESTEDTSDTDSIRPAAAAGHKPPTESVSEKAWHVREFSHQDTHAVLALFEQSFGHTMPLPLWRWKYPELSTQHSTLVEQNGKPVAFYGALPRDGLVMGQPTPLVQIGDVMVTPEARGILTRTGPFYLSAHALISKHIGPTHTYPYAFGFPNRRHVLLGIKRGLYCEVDKILSAHWPPQQQKFRLLGWREATVADAPLIDRLWQKMSAHCQEYAIGVRDSRWITHRYFDHPDNHYMSYILYGRLSGTVKGMAVLKRIDDNTLELLDILATPKETGPIIKALQHIAYAHNRSAITAWLTPAVLDWFKSCMPSTTATDVVIPGGAVNDKEHALKLKGKWWLMGGDTDSH